MEPTVGPAPNHKIGVLPGPKLFRQSQLHQISIRLSWGHPAGLPEGRTRHCKPSGRSAVSDKLLAGEVLCGFLRFSLHYWCRLLRPSRLFRLSAGVRSPNEKERFPSSAGKSGDRPSPSVSSAVQLPKHCCRSRVSGRPNSGSQCVRPSIPDRIPMLQASRH